MRRAFIALALMLACGVAVGSAVSAGPLIAPPERGYIADEAGVLGPEAVAGLNEALHELEEENGIEMAVVTVATTQPMSIEEYSVELFEDWGIGQRDQDNGLLVMLAVRDRRIRVEVGYGLEGILPDSRVGNLLDRVAVPHLAAGEFGEGVAALVDELARILLDEFDPVKASTPATSVWVVVVVIGAIAAVVAVVIALAVRRVPRCAACNRRMRKVAKEVLAPATVTAEGQAREKYRCSKCGAERWVAVALPRLTDKGDDGPADSGVPDQPGSDAGFGGGESGGGGASQRF